MWNSAQCENGILPFNCSNVRLQKFKKPSSYQKCQTS